MSLFLLLLLRKQFTIPRETRWKIFHPEQREEKNEEKEKHRKIKDGVKCVNRR